jgi:hypothetical protein
MPNDREASAHVNLFADQNLVQIMHGPYRLVIERDDQIALAQAGSFGGLFFSTETTSTPVSRGRP